MKLNSLTVILHFLTCFNSAWAENPNATSRIRYNDLPKLIREKNEKVQASESLAFAAKKRTGFLVRSFLPNISLKVGNETAKLGTANTENRDYWSANAQLNIYHGGRDNLEEKIRDSKAAAAESHLAQEYASELRIARKTYWQIVANTKILEELTEALKNNKENILSAKRRSGAGVATNADALQFELENTLLNQQLKRLNIEQDILQNRLAIMLSLDTHKDLLLDEGFSHPPEPSTVKTPTEFKTPDTEILKQEQIISDLQKTQASTWWLPSLDLYATYRRPSFLESDARALAKENEWAAGIMFSMNLGEGLEQRATKKAAELEAQATAHKYSYAQRTAQASFHDINHNLALLHELIHDADRDIDKAASFLKLTKTEYSRGVKNGPDLQEAFVKYYDFKTRRVELYRLYYETEADLAYLYPESP